MDLRQLECFVAVCEELHFSRAAEKLHMSQPSLSRHIRNLEAAVGMPLFDRMGRTIALTEAGRILLNHARRIFHEMEQARAAIRDLSGLQRGRLAIGSLFTVSYVLPPVISRFKRSYPNIELSVFGLRARDVADKLLDNELDLGITVWPLDEDDLEGVPLFEEELALAAPVGHPLAGRVEVPLRALADEAVILLPERYHLRALIDGCCAEAGVELKPALEMSSLDALVHMVADGAGVTVLPAAYIDSWARAELVKVRLVEPTPRRVIGLAYRKGKFMCATTRTFIGQLVDIAQERVGGEGAVRRVVGVERGADGGGERSAVGAERGADGGGERRVVGVERGTDGSGERRAGGAERGTDADAVALAVGLLEGREKAGADARSGDSLEARTGDSPGRGRWDSLEPRSVSDLDSVGRGEDDVPPSRSAG